MLERWLAHHLAEVMAEAGQAVGPAKAEAEAQAVDLILRLWAHRRAFLAPVDPLGGYRRAVEVLGRLAPDANPWAKYRRPGTYDDLLREMFELLGKIVLAGVLLTNVSCVRPVAEEELKALEEEERHLLYTLEQWLRLVAPSPSRPETEAESANLGMTEGPEADQAPERVDASSSQDRRSDAPMGSDDASLHAAIVAELERMQTYLTDLLSRWREASPGKQEDEDGNSVDVTGGSAAATDDRPDTLGDGEVTSEGPEAETAREE